MSKSMHPERRRRTPVSPNRSLKAAQVLEDLQIGATAVPPSMKPI
jgi:hypothetical protein